MPRLTAHQIERWIPSGLHQVAGCTKLKALMKQLVNSGGQTSNILITGRSSSCKTAIIKCAVKALVCGNTDRENFAACGKCNACQGFDVRQTHDGLFAEIAAGVHQPLNYYPINCGAVTDEQLRTLVHQLNQGPGQKLVYLDEVHRLVAHKREHLLLIPLRETDAVWIASSAQTEGLDEMFLNRFSRKLATELPCQDDLVSFLSDRCREWEITVDEPATLDLLARQARLLVGHALQVLGEAASTENRLLEREMVQEHQFYIEMD